MRQTVFLVVLMLAVGCGGGSSNSTGDGSVPDASRDAAGHEEGGPPPDGNQTDTTGGGDACVPTADSPDDLFADTNCDGIDGDASAAVFVAADGNDGAAGTRADPLLKVNDGIQKAAVEGKAVYVSTGTYFEALVLAEGVSIYGGYDRTAGWARSATAKATVVAPASGAVGKDLTQAVRLEYLVLQSADALASGTTSYGLLLARCQNVTLHQVDILAGAGAAGAETATQPAAVPGEDATQGGNGETIQIASGGTCQHGLNECWWPDRGVGGDLGGARHGGNGGEGGLPELLCFSLPPEDGAGGQPGTLGAAGGAAGAKGTSGSYAGGNGQPGTAGANGAASQTGGGAIGTFDETGYHATNQGVAGSDGGSGGGGGGGGGGYSYVPDISVCKNIGGAGGGGGQGGFGGQGGLGGGGGGGSIGVYLWAATASLDHVSIQTGDGGDGGRGQPGGLGGSAGIGKSGGAGVDGSGKGGNGGSGGAGGRGGDGAGGGGGPTIGVVTASGSTVQKNAVSFSTGNAGKGGVSIGTGAAGVGGTKADTHAL